MKRIRFCLCAVALIAASILWFKYESNWGEAIALISLTVDFCLYTYSLNRDVDGNITENRLFDWVAAVPLVSRVSYATVFFFLLYSMLT